MRTEVGFTRGDPLSIVVDGEPMSAFAGETIAAAMLATGRTRMRDDLHGTPRGLWCNMGTCSECFVERLDVVPIRRLRACLTPIEDGMRLQTGLVAFDE